MTAAAAAAGPGPAQPTGWRLLADIGGTNARFGLQRAAGAAIEQVRSLACADHATLDAALAAYLQASTAPAPSACAIGIATPVTGDRVAMTNHHWAFSQAALRQRLGLQRLLVINDFTALALALPVLPPGALRQVGGGSAVPGAAVALLGPGTGLGVSGLLPVAGASGAAAWTPIQGEGGHATLAAETALEAALLERLRQRHGHVSAERVLSGPGLAELAATLAALRAGTAGDGDRDSAHGWTAAEVLQHGLAGSDAVCSEALALFCGWLGQVAGNLALTLGARGGVCIGGGIVPRLGDWLVRSPFRQRFEAKGRFQPYLAAIPCFVIDAASQPALLGAARALDAAAVP